MIGNHLDASKNLCALDGLVIHSALGRSEGG